MANTKVNVLVFVLLSVNLTLARTILEAPSKENVEAIDAPVKDSRELIKSPIGIDSHIYERVPCEHEEATEDEVCQAHCLPRGYYYGLCVSKTCSCV